MPAADEQAGDNAQRSVVERNGRLRKQPMPSIASEDGGEPAKQEGGIGGAAKQLHARHQLVDDLKDRRVPAQGVEQGQASCGGEEADLAVAKVAAQSRQAEQQQR